jgi:predicted dehydrogenase
MSTGKLRVGIIGIGWYALSAHVPNLRSTGKAEVAAICRCNDDMALSR